AVYYCAARGRTDADHSKLLLILSLYVRSGATRLVPHPTGRGTRQGNRILARSGARERRYYISDLGGLDAKSMLDYVRGHWGIENGLHWSLDVTFREDTPRNRVGHSAENLSRIRRLALNLLRRDKTCRVGIKGKRLQACLKDEYLLRILSQGT
ncbi:MAG: ISAs1 family transposase, partial [Phycisphaerae bacterium]